MKKTIIGIVMGLVMYVPVFAQTVPDQATVTQQLVEALQQTIALLVQQVTQLQSQLALAIEQSNAQNSSLHQQIIQIQQTMNNQTTQPEVTGTTTIPVITSPTFGSVPEVDKSEILVETRTFPERSYVFIVSVLDNKGQYLKDFLVKMEAPDDLNSLKPNYKQETERGVTSINGSPYDAIRVYYTGFGYQASTTGEKIIKFTMGNLSKSITINVE